MITQHLEPSQGKPQQDVLMVLQRDLEERTKGHPLILISEAGGARGTGLLSKWEVGGGKGKTYPEGWWEQNPSLPSGRGLRCKAVTKV